MVPRRYCSLDEVVACVATGSSADLREARFHSWAGLEKVEASSYAVIPDCSSSRCKKTASFVAAFILDKNTGTETQNRSKSQSFHRYAIS